MNLLNIIGRIHKLYIKIFSNEQDLMDKKLSTKEAPDLKALKIYLNALLLIFMFSQPSLVANYSYNKKIKFTIQDFKIKGINSDKKKQ